MDLIRKLDAPIHEDSSEFRRYWLPTDSPFEVIEALIQPGARQRTHSHAIVREAVMLMEGEIFVAEVTKGQEMEKRLNPGDLVVFGCGVPHYVVNRSTGVARALTFKFLGDKKDSSLFASDKSNTE